MSGDRIAVVSGASHGIGREIAMTLAGRGFRVRGVGLGAEDLADTDAEAKQRGLDVRVVEGDVSQAGDVERFRKWVADTPGAVRALCNNAAVRPVGTVLTTAEADWDRVFAVNVKGVFLMTRAFLPAIVDSGGGSVTTISSCSALGGPNLIAYSSSKAALLAFNRCLAEDHRGERVRANVVLPGPIESGMTEGLPRELMEWCAQNGVAKRIGKPHDIASVVAFLASDEAETITGAELRVNYWPSLFG